ncbi:MAG: PIN domain-containing protein [Bryobacterales bacterium]|nr:PIN domain-containing protein [Bryobacterales bacterium]
MSVDFVDTNVLVYAHDGSAGAKHERAVALLDTLWEQRTGALSIQVLSEFYSVATGKRGIDAEYVRGAVEDLGAWLLHRPDLQDVLRAIQLQEEFQVSWWDALVLQSAIRLGASTLWTEDLQHNRSYNGVTVRNPFVEPHSPHPTSRLPPSAPNSQQESPGSLRQSRQKRRANRA